MKTEKIVEIIKNLIVNGKIHGKYDEETRGIEFTFAADEIDHLLKLLDIAIDLNPECVVTMGELSEVHVKQLLFYFT